MSQDTFLTDAILERLAAERKLFHSGEMEIEYADLIIRQANQLAAHAYDLEKRLHAAWNAQRWEKP